MGSPPKFFWNFRKCLNALFNSLKLLEDLFVSKRFGARGFFAKWSSPSSLSPQGSAHAATSSPCRTMAWPSDDKEAPLHRYLLPLTLLSPFLPKILDRGRSSSSRASTVVAVLVELAAAVRVSANWSKDHRALRRFPLFLLTAEFESGWPESTKSSSTYLCLRRRSPGRFRRPRLLLRCADLAFCLRVSHASFLSLFRAPSSSPAVDRRRSPPVPHRHLARPCSRPGPALWPVGSGA